jgi:PHD/YefM family antitoxin component YafN of YafNO toxin-antitoxin module
MKALHFLSITLLSIISCMSIIACSNDDSDKKNDEVVTITPLGNSQRYFDNGLTFTSQSGSENIEFTCNGDWNVSVANTIGGETWCTVTPANGKAGEGGFTVNVVENKGYDDRNVTLTLTVGNIKKTIVVTQKQKEAILLTANRFELDNKGGKINLEVKTNINYTVTINETDKKWIKQIGSNTRALSSSTLTFDISPNEEYEKREGVIYITNGELTETVHVYQASGGVVMLTKNEYFISDKEQTIAVDIKSNFNFEVKMPNVDWISIAPATKSMSSHTLYYIISPNEEYDSRESEIIFYDKSNVKLADTLKIIQAQKDAIIISKKEYEVNSKENTIEFEVNSNIDFNVSIPSAASKWIENITTTQTRGLTSHKVYLKINENTSTYERSAKVAIKHTQSNVADTVFISQLGVPSLSPSSKTYQTYPKGGELSVALTTNTNYTVEILGDAKEWIALPQTRSSSFRTDYLNLHIAENTGEARIGEVKVSSEGGETELTITVKQDSYIHEGNIYIGNNQSLQKIGEIGYKQINGNLEITSYGDITSLDVLSSITQINGNVEIRNCDITNFNGLNQLKKIQGNLEITAYNSFNNIQSFSGLERLEEIGGNFKIGDEKPLKEENRTSNSFSNLENFKGLENLRKIGGNFELIGNSSGKNYYGSYYLNSFNELKSFEGLERLATIGGNFRISSEGNDKYMTFKKLSSLSNLTNLTNIGGNFEIYAPNYAIAQLKTIELPALKQINGYLYMRNNNQMNLIFENLEVLGSFNCWYFTTINIPKLQKINKDLYIGIGKDIRGLDFTYYGNEQTILDCFSTIRYVGGNLQINCSGIETFKPLKNLEFVGNNLYFDIGSDDSSMLQSFEGFDKLVTIGGSLIWGTGWTSNPYPTLVKNNFSNIQSFQGFNNLSSIGGFRMSINYGDFSKFTSFAGLENLRQIKGDFTIEVEDSFWGLSDISALTNLETVEGSEFKIKGCYKLKDFTPLKQALTSYQGTFSTYSNGYNPTKSQILNGEGKQ